METAVADPMLRLTMLSCCSYVYGVLADFSLFEAFLLSALSLSLPPCVPLSLPLHVSSSKRVSCFYLLYNFLCVHLTPVSQCLLFPLLAQFLHFRQKQCLSASLSNSFSVVAGFCFSGSLSAFRKIINCNFSTDIRNSRRRIRNHITACSK